MSTLTTSTAVKMVVISPLAMAMTFCLILLMFSLVTKDYEQPKPTSAPPIPAVVMDKPGQIQTIENQPKPPEAVEPPPETKIEQQVDKIDLAMTDLVSRHIPVDTAENQIGIGDGALMPFYRVPPSYPERAISREVEGYVDLVFDVTSTGATANIRVSDAQPKGYFERAAIKAVKRWKYKPQISDGVAKRVRDQATRLEFKLEGKK